MKISRVLLAAVILGSVFSITYLQSDQNTQRIWTILCLVLICR
ncbi:hypothetical protein ACLNGX_02550 [Bacillus velezensis]|nr:MULTISPECIES: hypothetical protein [Bacillus]MCC9265438.1 hypothetical protein [Bacillus velezensis]MCQ9195272.1 hypothetical protein [Bacillus velezensis]MCX2918106.1 hypothetical protein [Bacillus velezensis]MCY6277000.1 hypothetical protein [Bacillus sp. NEAU-16]MDA3609632.1 hypothetical protein [Bacillus sp. NEAU-242-2]